MRAALLLRHGGPDALQLRTDWPVPSLRPGEVLVRVAAAAVNNTDVWTREGAYGLPGQPDAEAGWRGPLRFPRIQGGDVAGVVVDVAPEGPDGLRGRRVLVDPALYRDDQPAAPPVGLLGSEADGGFAEFVAVHATQVHDVTGSSLTDEQLACLPIAYGTALGMLERAAVGAGETVLVTGASGGVGIALVQLAAARGAVVIAVTTTEKAHDVQRAGATHVVLRDVGSLVDQLRGAAPDGLDCVADVAGGPLLGDLLPLVRDDGRWVLAGAVAGPVVPFDLRRLYLNNRTLIGSSMHTRQHFARLVEIARDAAVRPLVARRFDLGDIAEAQEEFRRGRHVGKVVLTL
jgi:NADPH:quinone reductase-like Zn-dependent oxidoreductase